MVRRVPWICFAAALSILCLGAQAQMIVHAMTGTVRSASKQGLQVTVNGSDQHFAVISKSKVQLDFDKQLRADSTPADQFNKSGAFAVIYFYGYDADQTAVAVKDLGAGPFERALGTVESFNKHDRQLIVATDAGAKETFKLSDQLVVDAGMKAEPGREFDPPRGSHAGVLSVTAGGQKTAVFIRIRR